MSSQADSVDGATQGTYEFQAETRQLLDIVVHSLYSNKEIFLRELISNASDALDRLRFEALTHPEVLEKGEILEIRLEANEDARTLEISDNGIGMSRQEVIDNIGTIAKSGSAEVMRDLEAEGDGSGDRLTRLIGQFGVGFYSSFMVADRVTLVTRQAGDEVATRWESSGDQKFEISDAQRFVRGTTVTLHLRPVDEENGLEDFTHFDVLERIVKRYSDFVSYPIRTKRRSRVPSASSSTSVEEVTLNSMQPIWTRSASEVSDEEYAEFYKHITHDWNEPLDRLLLRAEGRIDYQVLLYLPSKAPSDLFYREQNVGLQLYVRKVLIKDHFEELLPPYLRFFKGVVDSSDLPLNVSRELLQQDRLISQMRKWITRKILDHLDKMMSDEREKYARMWVEFGRVLKEGVGSSPDSAKRLGPLLLFESSNDPKELTSLAEYIERMPDGQEEIYYLTGDSRAVVENAPQLEGFLDRGLEVLFLVDPIDEFLTHSLTEFEDRKLRSAAKGDADLAGGSDSEEAKKEIEDQQQEYEDLLRDLEGRLSERVKKVRLTRRLTSSPACLVGDDDDLSPQLERILRQSNGGMLGAEPQKRILELNPGHDIIVKLRQALSDDSGDPNLDAFAQLLLGYALIAEGSELPEPMQFNRLLVDLMVKAL